MRQQSLFPPRNTSILGASLIVLCIMSTVSLRAQTAANFAGKWEFDKAKSSPGTVHANYPGTVTRQITQNSSRLTYRDVYVQKGSSDWKTTDEIFTLDGKEQIKKDGANTRRKSAKWSEDKKILTLTYAETYVEGGVSKELSVAESYALSEEGKTLTIETFSKNQVTGETKTTSVYRKK
jgi:hypothetical protein